MVKCLVLMCLQGDRNVRWSLLIALRTYLDSGLMLMCFGGCSSFLCSFCSIGFQMACNLNDIPLMWCLFSSE